MMVVLTINNAESHVDCDRGIFVGLRDLLSFEVEGSDFVMRSHPHWNWDGRTRLLKKNGVFPTGLVRRVITWLRKNKFKYEIRDKRSIPSPCHEFSISEGWEPRYYQTDAVTAAESRPRGVFVIGTGGGKTFTAALLIKSKGLDTLFVTPDTGLLEQAFDDFQEMLGDVVSKDIRSGAPIVVSNIQSLVRKQPKDFERFGLLLIDEFHHSAANSYIKLNKLACNAYHRHGFTGTFMRPDGADMTMHGVLSDIIYEKSTSELIEEGFLVRPYIKIIKHELKGWSRLNYKAAYDKIITDVEFNTKISRAAERKIEEGKQTLILVRRKEHGEFLHRMIGGSEYVCGDHPMSERKEMKSRFIRRELPCLIATNILGEGQNIPSIDVLINARLQKTEVQTMQGIGRALRKTEGKDRAEIYDFFLTGQRNFSAHSAYRVASYRKEKAFRISFVRS